MRLRLHSSIIAWLAAITLWIPACSDDPSLTVSTGGPGTSGPIYTHLRGQVLDIGTLQPIAGVAVRGADSLAQTDANGYYNLQRLRVGATDLVATREGYDTARTILPLRGGDQEFNIRMRRTAAARALGTPERD